MEWKEEAVINFIEKYREKECLWDTKHPAYYNKIIKNLAWEEIAEYFDITADECRRKMTALMSGLRREKAKIKKSQEAGRSELYQSSWFAFKSLLFLWDKKKIRVSLPKEKDDDAEEDNDDNKSSVECDEIGMILSPECNLQTNPQPPPPPPLSSTVQRKRSAVEEQEDAYQISSKVSKDQEYSENEIFGNLVAKKLNKYSKFTAISVQEEIMHILFKADRGLYDQQSSSVFSQQQSHPGTSNT